MPVTIYQSADAAARNNKLEQLIFIWELNDPEPVSGKFDLECYEAKIAALVPLYGKRARLYSSHENAGRDKQVYPSDLRGMIRPWSPDWKDQGRQNFRGRSFQFLQCNDGREGRLSAWRASPEWVPRAAYLPERAGGDPSYFELRIGTALNIG